MNLDRALLAAQVLGAAMLAWVSLGASQERRIGIGDRAPEFSVVADDGRKLSTDNFGGKLLMIHFWATWCPPCVYELPGLNELGTRMQSRGLVVLGMSFDEQDAPYRRFLERLQPAFLTTRAGARELAAAFGTFRIPETYIIDRNGRVVRKYVDAQHWTDPAVLNELEGLLR